MRRSITGLSAIRLFPFQHREVRRDHRLQCPMERVIPRAPAQPLSRIRSRLFAATAALRYRAARSEDLSQFTAKRYRSTCARSSPGCWDTHFENAREPAEE